MELANHHEEFKAYLDDLFITKRKPLCGFVLTKYCNSGSCGVVYYGEVKD